MEGSWVQPGACLSQIVAKLMDFISQHGKEIELPDLAGGSGGPTVGGTPAQPLVTYQLPKHITVIIAWAGNEVLSFSSESGARTELSSVVPAATQTAIRHLKTLTRSAIETLCVIAGAEGRDWGLGKEWDARFTTIREDLRSSGIVVWSGHQLARDTMDYRVRWWNHRTRGYETDMFHNNQEPWCQITVLEFPVKLLRVLNLGLSKAEKYVLEGRCFEGPRCPVA